MHPHWHLYQIANLAKAYGCCHVVISPGSRSAPLVYAFAWQKNFTLHQVVDERSAAFQALGMAESTNTPVVLICTSGTAAANYYPAIAEAHYKGVKLLVLTADRPPELLNQQDGQMIDQKHLYGAHALQFYALKTTYTFKEQKPLTATLNHLFGNCFIKNRGVLHLNVPLTEPLYLPLPKHVNQKLPAFNFGKDATANTSQIKPLLKAYTAAEKVLIVVGNHPMDAALTTALLKLQQNTNTIILADVSSNQNYTTPITNFDWLIEQADASLLKQLEPTLLITLGGPVLSKSLKLWLQTLKPTHHFRLQHNQIKINTYGNLTHTLIGEPNNSLAQLMETPIKPSNYKNIWVNASQKLNTIIENKLHQAQWSEMPAMAKVLAHLPIGSNLHLANSSVVRYVSKLGLLPNHVTVTANRGTSGIDGCTSTAVGAALVNNTFTILLTGDLGFLYDFNALWLNQVPNNLRIIIFNNNGGGIFNLIDGPKNHPQFLHHQTTPHQQNLKLLTQARGIDYYLCNKLDLLDKTLGDFFNPLAKAAVLELKFDLKKGEKLYKAFKKI